MVSITSEVHQRDDLIPVRAVGGIKVLEGCRGCALEKLKGPRLLSAANLNAYMPDGIQYSLAQSGTCARTIKSELGRYEREIQFN